MIWREDLKRYTIQAFSKKLSETDRPANLHPFLSAERLGFGNFAIDARVF